MGEGPAKKCRFRRWQVSNLKAHQATPLNSNTSGLLQWLPGLACFSEASPQQLKIAEGLGWFGASSLGFEGGFRKVWCKVPDKRFRQRLIRSQQKVPDKGSRRRRYLLLLELPVKGFGWRFQMKAQGLEPGSWWRLQTKVADECATLKGSKQVVQEKVRAEGLQQMKF